MRSRPPRVAVRLLTHRLPAEWRDFVIGDLEEEFDARCAASRARATAWFWWQAIRCVAFPPPERFSSSLRASRPPGDSMLRTLLSDVRYGVRVLFHAPSFTVAVVLVLALGIGANTAIFSIVNTVLLRPLPFDEPDRLVRLFHVPPQATFPGLKRFSVSPANFYDWQQSAQLFDGMVIYSIRPFTLTGSGANAEAIMAGAVGAGFFDLVRVPPALGRTFLAEEDTPGRRRVVVLSDKFWRSHFGASPAAVGQTLNLSSEAYTIVGVMPPRFSMAAWAISGRDLWVPLAHTDEQRAVRDNHNEAVIARLKPGVTVAQAQSEMDAISQRLEREYPQANTGWGATVVPLQELIVGDIRLSLLTLLAAVGLVLLIACANVGNLLFARALGRRKELAIRAALGAGRGRVFQQLLVEALLLAGAGGVAGLLLARGALQASAALLANQVPRADEMALDWRVLAFVLATSVITGVLAGALPALRAGRSDLNDALKEGGRSDSAVGLRTRRMLIVCEVALSLLLLVGAGLMIRTLWALRHVDAGFDSHNVLTMRVMLPKTRYATAARITGFFDTALQRIRALPGVQAAAFVDDLPMRGGSVQPIVLEGHAELLPRDQPTVGVRKISPGFLQTMRVPLLRGRDVKETDTNVMVVSRGAAKLLWGDADPVGRRVTLPLESKGLLKEVVGIVGDVKQENLFEPATPTIYEYTHEHEWNGLAFVVRTAMPPDALGQAAAAAIRAIDPEQPVEAIRSMDAVLDETLTSQRFTALLLGVFAGVALALASVGIYSVLSYIVRGRSREIGIRTALGAKTRDVVALVVVEGMTPAVAGIVLGILAALVTGKLLEKMVFGVSAWDPLTLAAVAATLGLVALVASLLPAYRAARVDPQAVLRSS
jgi:putative ABC transport system permease protein